MLAFKSDLSNALAADAEADQTRPEPHQRPVTRRAWLFHVSSAPRITPALGAGEMHAPHGFRFVLMALTSAPNAPHHAPAEVFVPHTSASPCHLQATSKSPTSTRCYFRVVILQVRNVNSLRDSTFLSCPAGPHTYPHPRKKFIF